jgi:anti-anti-sigma regulatory factor
MTRPAALQRRRMTPARLSALLAAGCVRLRLELARLTFCDVVGFTVLLDTAAAARAAGGGLVIDGPCRSLRRLLEVSALDEELVPVR